jgi:endonuclease YncB( thermonuclease family)
MKFEDTYIRKAKVINIIAGDTFDGVVDLGFHIKVKERFRVLGIDAPEKSGVTREAGLKSKQYLVDNLLNKEVILISAKLDGFRRCLADVYITNVDGSQSKLSDVMVEEGLASLLNR